MVRSRRESERRKGRETRPGEGRARRQEGWSGTGKNRQRPPASWRRVQEVGARGSASTCPRPSPSSPVRSVSWRGLRGGRETVFTATALVGWRRRALVRGAWLGMVLGLTDHSGEQE
jgi:hypothetical protein